MQINRRDFMKLIGGSLAGLAVGSAAGALMKIPKSMEPVLYSGPRKESWKLTACTMCPGGCSLKVRLIDNLPIQAFGNPLSPVNEGGICSMGLASVARLYHPDRLTGPMKNENGKFVSISYDEAYKILKDELEKVITNNKQDDVFIVAQTESKLRAEMFKKFSEETGFSNLIIENFRSNNFFPYNQVSDEAPDFIDFDKCDYLLNFGSQITEVSENPLYYTRKIIEHRSKGFKLTAVQPKLTPSISKSDDWAPLLPVSYADFALGIAYVLLRDEQYDKAFVEKYFSGFNDFKQYVLDNYFPDKVQELTGVPSDKILEIGREFEKAAAPAAYFDEAIFYNSNGTENALAVIALNALKGFSGFGKLKEEFFSKILENEKKHNEEITFANLKARLSGGKALRALVISGSNFVYNSPNQAELKKQLSAIPFIVSFSSFVDETSSLAHLIIPDHDDFEKFDLLIDNSMGKPAATLLQPVVDHYYNTIDTSDVLISLMKDLKTGAKVPYENYNDYIKQIANKIYSSHEGILMDQSKPTVIEKGLRKIGWQTEQYSSFDDFWDGLLDAGGWWNPFADKTSYNPKIDYKSNFNKENKPVNKSLASLPNKKLRLNIFRKNLDYKGSMSIYPVLVEQFGLKWTVFYQLWAEINPDTASKYSLQERSKVVLKTSKGSFPVVLVFNPSVIPGSIDVPFGFGHTNFGDNCGANPLVYSDDVFDKSTGKPSFSETLVEIDSASTGSSSFTAQIITDEKKLSGTQNRSVYA
ncbi:MAG: molybdopterin-dependent oxidoreductase [Bacteroidetes bacterium]|nr:molybdopterin-dependent oxidoreductase [Bacteroidota bacterium]